MGLRVHDKMTSLQEKCLEINAYSCGVAGIRNQEALPVRVDMVAVVRSAARLHTDITVMRDENKGFEGRFRRKDGLRDILQKSHLQTNVARGNSLVGENGEK
ncbi:hypothetical protein KOW79_005725 [Hemibagrus wyckioides]|uniref:Uncharacterized protein n=1 Tax=Hemibagrus wyckioides TaxID=337641 RepID=A0A9D3P0A6_9TELE|nr:hypothetical protein KOW79_005725 [Hemibagrus wyckioides]